MLNIQFFKEILIKQGFDLKTAILVALALALAWALVRVSH